MQIRSMVETSESGYDKDMLQDRLAKLSESVAVIKVVKLICCNTLMDSIFIDAYN